MYYVGKYHLFVVRFLIFLIFILHGIVGVIGIVLVRDLRS